jgi:hypothetical protein
MNKAKLVSALRVVAKKIYNDAYEEGPPMDHTLKTDIYTLMLVLANVTNGMEVSRAFGAPGDWGDDIADALRAAPEVKEANNE